MQRCLHTHSQSQDFRDKCHEEAVHPALTRIYTLTRPFPFPPPPRHHAVLNALLHPARHLLPSSHSGSARLSYRAPDPLRRYHPEFIRTRTQRHIWSRQHRWSILHKRHSGRKAVRRLDRHGQVRLSHSTLPSVLTYRFLWYKNNPSSDLWVSGSVPNAKNTAASAKIQYAVGAAEGTPVFFFSTSHDFDSSIKGLYKQQT